MGMLDNFIWKIGAKKATAVGVKTAVGMLVSLNGVLEPLGIHVDYTEQAVATLVAATVSAVIKFIWDMAKRAKVGK